MKIKKYSIFAFFIILLVGVVSCKRSSSSSVDSDDVAYRLYNLANVGWKSKTLSHHLISISYKATQVPLQYYILKNGDTEDPVKVDSIYKSHANERIIEFEFRHDSKDDLLKSDYTKKGYTESVKYMAFGIEKDFEIITEKGDTIVCSGVTFERNFKLAPFKRILLHFGNVPEQENIKLIYEDKLFGSGLLKYNFKETPIQL